MAEVRRVALLTIPFTGFDRGLVEGISRYAQFHGPWVFYLSGDPPGAPVPAVVPDSHSGKFRNAVVDNLAADMVFPDLHRSKVTGVIGRIQSAKVARRILASGLPAIAIDLAREQLAAGNPLSQISEVRAGSHAAGRIAAEHFLERGFRNFAFCGYSGRIWSDQRLEGFADRLRQKEFQCDAYEPRRGQLRESVSWGSEQRFVASWLESLPKPVAVMACNDIRGRQVLEACLLTRLNVPEDVAVIGVDNDTLVCNLTNPPLSSVVFNLEQAGYAAAEHLDGLMSGVVKEPRRIDVEPLWAVGRRSTDVIATEDRHVSAALRFIRDHSRERISVEDVAEHANISRRNLEIRFRHNLGRSVRDEIERSRLAFARQLLKETNLSVERVALLAGFGSLGYFGKVFHRRIGTSPVEFRHRRAP